MSADTQRNHLVISGAEFLNTWRKVPTIVLDVRIGNEDEERASHLSAHIPGAIFTTVAKHFSGKVTATSGAFPLPLIEEFQTIITDLGVEPDTRVIVYSPNPAVAARAWWVFRWSGFDNVLLLDGGLKAFVDAGGEAASLEVLNVPMATEKPAIVSADHLKTLGYDEIPQFVRIGILLDARAPEAFGTEEAPTHIPGAQNAPSTQVWDADGRLRADEELRSFFKAFIGTGEKPVAASCGGGVMGAYAVLALKAIGVDAPLYVGSYSEWSKRQAAAKVEGSAQ